MSNQPIEWEHDARGLRFAVVASRFNPSITDKLLAGAREALERADAASVEVFHVPGAFELPLAAKLLAATRNYDAIIALGAVIRGETPHFDFVASEAARGLQQVALEELLPVAFGVLTTDTLSQAEARARKGYEVAMSAVEMARFSQSVTKAVRADDAPVKAAP